MMTFRTALAAATLTLASHVQAQVTMTIDATQRGPLTSPYQYGLFFEEINHAGDGGLYAELVRNRSFEEGTDGWTAVNGASLSTVSEGLLNSAQGRALRLTTATASATRQAGVRNAGFWGMKIEKDATYTLTLWAKGSNTGYTGNLTARLLKSDGQTAIGEAPIEGTVETDRWNKLTATIKATDTDLSGQLLLLTGNNGRLDLDVVSLFPTATWNSRPNGLRPDLAQLLADTHPRFLRFPGGCYVEGEATWDNAFQWKKTIGPIEQRPGHMNQNWHYWSTDGLGFDEYLQLAEDMGAAPMFVVNVGLGHGYYIPMEDLDTLVQNTLDAIEYANGDGSTKWGAQRIKNGHTAPYNLKFIEIGNENYNFYMQSNSDQSYEYPERYYKFYQAIKEKYPEIVTIGNVEAWGTDNPSWRNEYPVELVDEHYYRSHSWMRENYQKYDNYNRSVGVYVGEYAANASGTYGTYGNMNSALGEAIFMLGMEKNADVVRMGSFAPIFMHESDPCWPYDMIHFNSGRNFVTPSYYVQKLMGSNLGYQNLKWTETGNSLHATASHQVGLATWNTQASFDDVRVTNGEGTVVLSDDFTQNSGWSTNGGSWSVASGTMRQTASGTNSDRGCRNINLTKFYDNDYTLELRARKDGGAEGFLIIFDYQDADNYIWWNIAGWNNTQHAIEVCTNGAKSTLSPVSGAIATGQWYDLKVTVTGSTVRCYIDGTLTHEFDLPTTRALYQSVQLSEDGRELILKVVNPNDQAQTLKLDARNMTVGTGTVERLTAASGTTENTMSAPDRVKPTEPETVNDATKLDIPAYSLNIFRLGVSDVAEEVKTTYPAYEKEDEGKAAYLYAHMSSQGEYTGYALSLYGQTWSALLDGKEVFDTQANTVTGGMRDAYVLRLENGGFMLAGTDMTSRLGWESNHIMDLMLSPDLVHWTKNVKIDLETPENLAAVSKVPELQDVIHRNLTAAEMTAAWAPQVIYDPETRHYVLYYSVGYRVDFGSTAENDKWSHLNYHRTFYQLIDENLNILTEPRLYFDPGFDIIDDDIVWNDMDKQYVMIFKCEQTRGFDRATAQKLVPDEGATGTTVWTRTPGFHVDESNQNIEGPTQWRLIGSTRWKLAYINYQNGYVYRMRDMDEHNLNHGAYVNMSGNVRAQHGSIIKITMQEYNYLKTWEAVLNRLPEVRAFNQAKTTEQHTAAIAAAEEALTKVRPTFDENVAAMEQALKLLQACSTDMAPVLIEEAVKNGYGDLTPLIVNADFSQGNSGWYRTPEFTQANGNVAEFWNTSFGMGQTVEGLPQGRYRLQVQSFYRYGNIDPATSAHRAGTEQLNAKLFANGTEVPIVSLYDESVTRYAYSPYSYPDNVSQANTAFNSYGLYTNTLDVELGQGEDLSFGLYSETSVQGDWCCFDNFKLTYLGPPTGIDTKKRQPATDGARYDLNGRRVGNAGKGIYIYKGGKYRQ